MLIAALRLSPAFLQCFFTLHHMRAAEVVMRSRGSPSVWKLAALLGEFGLLAHGRKCPIREAACRLCAVKDPRFFTVKNY
jgi:hypothetical protein